MPACTKDEVRDFYKLLGVDKDASEQDIKKAFRKLSLTCHPDKHPDRAAEYEELARVKETLCDKQLRQTYDYFVAGKVDEGLPEGWEARWILGNSRPWDFWNRVTGEVSRSRPKTTVSNGASGNKDKRCPAGKGLDFVQGDKSIVGGLTQKPFLNGQCVELIERRSDGRITVRAGSVDEPILIAIKEENLGPWFPGDFLFKVHQRDDNGHFLISCSSPSDVYYEIHGIPSSDPLSSLNGRRGKWAVPSCKKPFGDCFTLVLDDGHRRTIKREHLRACCAK